MEVSTDTNRRHPLVILVNIPRILLLLSYSVQAAFLDYFLIQYYDFFWFLWLIPDFVILAAFIFSIFISFLELYQARTLFTDPQKTRGVVPFGAECWLLYSAVLVAKLAILLITRSFLTTSSSQPLGPNSFLIITGITLAVYYFYIESASISRVPLNQLFSDIQSTFFILDVLDSTDILINILFYPTFISLPSGIEGAIIFFSLAVYLMPVFHLLLLRFGDSDFGTRWTHAGRSLELLVNAFVVQVPLFVLRVYVWASTGSALVSQAFLVKDGLLAVVALYELVVRIYRAASALPDRVIAQKPIY